MCSHVTAVLLLSLTSFKVSKSHEPAQILQRNLLLSEGTHIIIPLTTFEEHVSTLHHVSCPDKRADNQALIVKYFVKLHQKTLYHYCCSPCTCRMPMPALVNYCIRRRLQSLIDSSFVLYIIPLPSQVSVGLLVLKPSLLWYSITD